MGHNDRRRWTRVGGGYERAASKGRTWRVRPVGPGWRLEAVDPNAVGWLGGNRPTTDPVWDASTAEACQEIVDAIDRHEALEKKMERRSFEVERQAGIPGITLRGRRSGTTVYVDAYLESGGERPKKIGWYQARLSGWKAGWVIGEPTFDGGSSVDAEWIGRGVGRALYDLAEEMAGVPLTPHGRFGTGGGRTKHSTAFWVKRALHQRVPGVGDPEVARRDAERERVSTILMLTADNWVREPYLMAAIAMETGWDVRFARSPQTGDVAEAWCLDGSGAPFSAIGPDTGIPNVPGRGLPVAVETATPAEFLAVLEAQPLDGPDEAENAQAHREAVAERADLAAIVLGRYAGMAVCEPSLRDRIAAGGGSPPAPRA